MQKIPHPVDRHVGARVRAHRISIGVSQVQLGAALGVTFQQIQKYEKGANRISASRLQQMSALLGTPVHFFFEGIPDAQSSKSSRADDAEFSDIASFLATDEGKQLLGAFTRIASARRRRRILDLVEALGEGQAE